MNVLCVITSVVKSVCQILGPGGLIQTVRERKWAGDKTSVSLGSLGEKDEW